MERIYLDNNATTMVDPLVRDAMDVFTVQMYGNPNSLHVFGSEVHPYMRLALDRLYKAINATDDDDIIVNSCGTEGNNTVLKSIWYSEIFKGKKKRIITSQIEHPAISETTAFLESLGAEILYLPVDKNGIISADELKQVINSETDALVSIMWANNETGLINPMKELVAVAHEAGVLFHTDAVQALGKVVVDVQEVPVDFLTFSAHKFHGPKGVGGLYVRKGSPIVPLFHGGEQMGGLRSGTVNVAGMIGMGLALEMAIRNLGYEQTVVRQLRDRLEDAFMELSGVLVIGSRDLRTPNTCFVSFKGVEGEGLLWDLNRGGICASTGSACASESLQENPTFKAIGISSELAHTGIRFSLSRFTTTEEIEKTIEVVTQGVNRLRAITTTTIE